MASRGLAHDRERMVTNWYLTVYLNSGGAPRRRARVR